MTLHCKDVRWVSQMQSGTPEGTHAAHLDDAVIDHGAAICALVASDDLLLARHL